MVSTKLDSNLISAVGEWKDEKFYQVQVKHFSYDRDGHEQGYEWMTFAEQFDSVKAILESPQYSNMQLVHENIRILITRKEFLVLRKKVEY